MLLAHGRFEHIKMFGDLSFYYVVQDNTDDQNALYVIGPTISSFTFKYFVLQFLCTTEQYMKLSAHDTF